MTQTIRAREGADTRPDTLKSWLHDGREIALLDVREHGQYGESHLFYAVNAPYSQLEFEAARLVPRRTTRVVVYDDGDGVAGKAASALRAQGYDDVSVLDGGVPAWRAAGYQLFAGVNLPSKTFGELAEHELHTPAMTADELNRRIQAGENLIVLDGRPYTEYQKMSIPTATCCPNGELALRVDDLVPDESTTIVINCAGRTRSIIGAQTLINLGVKNPVYALENGTQGWYLKDYALDHGQARRHALRTQPQSLRKARDRARALAARFRIETIAASRLHALQADAARTTYVFDVRTPEEYRAGTHAGAAHAPGGQLIQATDQYVGTRGARLVLVDGEGVRAPTVATWMRQLGWEVYVLEDAALDAAPAPLVPVPATLARIDSDRARALRDDGALFIDVRPSMAYRREHIAGAQWSIRGKAASPAGRAVVLVADDARVAELYARDLPAGSAPLLLVDGPAQWDAAGLPRESTPDVPPDADCIDFLFFVHDRHSGNKAAAIKYLEWETNLVTQIDERERASYRFTP
ncbi:rhodanese-like domain-containing protein [Bordetella genomosp. 13]|uniref:rhodanese-like domain-containing protein n=1 Tax=Bordetella genomosp. 13 TaxID=463040 RepID=UPI0011A3ACD7|nr:rhodanese-like domain-containing protein [Bordetella genomosp. 13]